MPFHKVNAYIKTPRIMNVCRPVSDMCILWRACNLAPLAFQLFSHTCTYTFIYPPTHLHTPTATCSSMTKMQTVHFCRIAQCTMVKNVPCAWQFICKASSNTLCTLFVQTLTIQKLKRFIQLNYKCPCLLCPCSRCVQRGAWCIVHGTHQQ